MKNLILITIVLFILLPYCICEGKEDTAANKTETEPGVVKVHYRGLHGYIDYGASLPPDRSIYSSGMGFYSAVRPLIDKPIAQVPGDGRWVLNTDRASHFNLTTFLQWKDHKLTDRT
ncbi:MAG: hypothetical protein JRC90_11495, partial [Deltaproteobacteria bacterium]|nr:hypothetical protein [Deltaproteobacteria bacterium]